LSVVLGYCWYVAVSVAVPVPRPLFPYETVTVVDAPGDNDADDGDAEHDTSGDPQLVLKLAVAVNWPVFCTVKP